MLEIDQVSVRYGPFLALDGVSLNVNEGEIVGVIGPNGAGKSSLARAIVGLEPTAGGSIRFGGQLMQSGVVHERITQGLSLVPEGRGLFAQMSVEDNLLMGAYTMRASAAREQALREAFELFPVLDERRDQRAGTLSGGQQQMLAVAVGLMTHPRLCVFDEPSLGLAPIVIEQIGNTLKAMKRRGLTVLLIEQNATLAMSVAERIYVMAAGSIRHQGTPEALMRNPEVLETFLSA
jgi:branched-chain amino acid transport system ATP-binding protein